MTGLLLLLGAGLILSLGLTKPRSAPALAPVPAKPPARKARK